MSTLVAAEAPYLRADKPIVDENGHISVIVDFLKDAHLKYSADVTILPRTKRDQDEKAVEFFQNPKTEALVTEFEKAYSFRRTGMTSWVGNSVSAYLTPTQIGQLRADGRVKQVSEDSLSAFSSWSDTPGAETVSWGRVAVSGQVRTVNNSRKIYIIDSGVADHVDLSSVSSRINVACGAAACNVSNPNTYPVVGCYAHSTHLAGIIGAQSGNGMGTAGIYAGANMVSLSVLSRSGGDMCGDSNTVAASNWAAVGYALDYVYWDTLYNNVQQWVNVVNISINTAGLSIAGNNIPQSNREKAQKVASPDVVWVGCGIVP